jgi:hypothetical protein
MSVTPAHAATAQRVRREYPGTNPDEFAALIYDAWDDDERDEALRAYCRTLAQQLWGRHRRAVMSHGSWRNDQMRDALSDDNIREIRVHARGGWKRYGDCTDDDLTYAETERMDIARANERWAGVYADTRKAMREFRVTTAGQLPDSVLDALTSPVRRKGAA